MSGHTCNTVFSINPRYGKSSRNVGEVPKKGKKDDQKTGKPVEESLREISLLNIKKRRLGEDFVTMFQHLKGDCKDGGSFFPRSHVEKMRDNTHKLVLQRSQLDTKGKFFIMGTISHWNYLPRGYSGQFC